MASPDLEPSGAGFLARSVGIGVSDLAKSVEFYTRACGMQQLQTFDLPYMDEVVLGFVHEGTTLGYRLVLMHWKDGSERNYKDNPVKLVWQVPDAKAFVERIRAAGGVIEREPGTSSVSKSTIGFALDPDGYRIEIMQLNP
jgi:lactoylglutathione lyase